MLQYMYYTNMQALENNLNNYYYQVGEKATEKKDLQDLNFFSSFFNKQKTIDTNNEEELNESGTELEIELCKNDDSFFIYEENKNNYSKRNELRYSHIKNENYFVTNERDAIDSTSTINNTNSNINLNKNNSNNHLLTTDEKIKYVRGLYVYGSVGRGKTYFLNILFDRIKLKKLKIHYHNFMQHIHKKFHEEKINHSENPIKNIAISMSKQYKLIYIDEFQVVHISDAMILKSLFKYLFDYGVVLICSSNRNPKHLYHNGLNRDRFIPFIKLLFKHNYIYEINNYQDFRLKDSSTVNIDSGNITNLSTYTIFNVPSPKFEEIKKICNNVYCSTYNKDKKWVSQVEKYNAKIPVSALKNCIIPYILDKYCIFSFNDICGKNISIDEFNAIANMNSTIFIYNIEKMNEETKGNEMRRFILLIDILYEKNTRVFFFSDTPIFQIFQENTIISLFQLLINKIKEKHKSFNDFKNFYTDFLKLDSFNKKIFDDIMLSMGITNEISEKLFKAINYNINKEYIPIEYLRKILCFHVINYELDIKKHLAYFNDNNSELELIPYLLFDENDIDTSQENAFAFMRTLSRMKHMSTKTYLEKHKKLYEHNI
uniref:Nucleotide binding protein n=1 Tax=Piliocolobus tephrosceles TaxID=591936 RepID=A0A8C9HVR9_9PRIM